MAVGLTESLSRWWMSRYNIAEPELLTGHGAVASLAQSIVRDKRRRVLVAASRTVIRKQMLADFLQVLEDAGLAYEVFTEITPDPTVENVEAGLELYLRTGCDCVAAVGGGSVIDCAKLIALRARNLSVSVYGMEIPFIPLKQGAPLYVAPTTAGAGSEVTLFAVVTDEKKQKKCPVISNHFLPLVVALDPTLAVTVPKEVTIYAGVDALSHSLEAYVSRTGDRFPEDRAYADQACKQIMTTLPQVLANLEDESLRLTMQKSAYEAGLAFRRIGTGYVHSIAHRLGESFHLPHGACIAMALPWVLEKSLPVIAGELAVLSQEMGLSKEDASPEEGSRAFLAALRQFLEQLDLPKQVKVAPDQELDLEKMVRRIQKEAAVQGCPMKLTDEDLLAFLQQVMRKE